MSLTEEFSKDMGRKSLIVDGFCTLGTRVI
jgi:hypothetical protein